MMMLDPAQVMQMVWLQVGNSPEAIQLWQQAEARRAQADWQGALELYQTLQASDDPWREGSTLSGELWAMAGIRRSSMLAELGQGWEARDVVDEVGTVMAERKHSMTPLNLLSYYYARIHAAVVIKDEVGLISPMGEALNIAVNQLRQPQRVVEIWEIVLGGLAWMEDWGVLRLRSNQATKYLAILDEPHRSRLAARIEHYLAEAEAHKDEKAE